jgi:hypothetical protein
MEVNSMQQTKQMETIDVAQAFSLLKSGTPIFIAPAPEGEKALQGAWKDSKANIYRDRSAFYLRKEMALQTARAFQQQVIFCLYPFERGNGRVYLLKDHIHNRTLALRHTGGYVSDGEHLLVACLGDKLPFEGEVIDELPADLVLSFTVA